MLESPSERLPEFAAPPVVEVAVSVQLQAPVLDVPMIMRWWAEVHDRFPGVEHTSPVPPVVESFDTPKIPQPLVQLQLVNTPPVPRFFLKTATETELIQIQQDRFGYSWRRLKESDAYPRYINLRKNFGDQLDAFEKFLAAEHSEPLKAALCEVTYVNHITGGGVWHSHSELQNVIPSVKPRLTEDFLPLPEDMQFTARYIIPGDTGPAGRLYVAVEPRFLVADMSPIFLMRLTARGFPLGSDHAGMLKMLDIGHEWIVRGFTTLTSKEMHKFWGRTR